MARAKDRTGGKRAGRRAANALCILGIVASLAVLGYLNLADWLAQWEAEQNITRISNMYDDANDPERLEYLRQAHLYNDVLQGKHVDDPVLPYGSQLFYKQEPMISYIEIPSIAVRLPIYHGTEENALMAGVGHLEGTSLPVGGEGTHCVLTGHSGMRNTRMFDDLHRLEAGDEFVIWTLSDPYAYRVYASEVVLPEEAPGRIAAEPGSDLVTLVTCTPYGVNTHRLLVHAQRCEYDPETVPEVGVEAYLNLRSLPLALGLVLVAAIAVATAARRARKGKQAGRAGLEDKTDRQGEGHGEHQD